MLCLQAEKEKGKTPIVYFEEAVNALQMTLHLYIHGIHFQSMISNVLILLDYFKISHTILFLLNNLNHCTGLKRKHLLYYSQVVCCQLNHSRGRAYTWLICKIDYKIILVRHYPNPGTSKNRQIEQKMLKGLPAKTIIIIRQSQSNI